MKAKTTGFGWRRLGTVAGTLGLSMVLIWRVTRGTTSPFIYFAGTPSTVLIQWWLAFGLFENLWGGSAAKPRTASWVAAINTSEGHGLLAIARRWIVSAVKSAVLVFALTVFLRIPLDFMGSVVVGMALASLAVVFGLGGGLVAMVSNKSRKIVRGVMLAILAGSLIVWIVECLELNLIPGEPLRAFSILLLSGGWHWFFPSQWILGIGEGLVNGNILLPYLLGPFGLLGLMVAMYLGPMGQRRTIPSSPGIKKLPGDRRDKVRHSKFSLLAVKAVAVMMLFSIACNNQETSQPNKTATSGPEPKPLPGVAVPSKLFEERQPGAVKMSRSIRAKIEEAWNRREQDYIPRTRHLHSEKVPKYTNRLFLETSPYLMQHAHNPVDWFAWGDEAFETARKLGRPVFLSVGYSTCHWCHVMEEESFEDEEIARFMNENYISIKVDREERPDVDAIYMNAVQTLTGRGGWPMSVWLTPDRKPFYGGTYFPARDGDRGSSTGFLTLLDRLKDLYDDDPDRVIETSTRLVESIQRNLSARPGGTSTLKDSILKRAARSYVGGFDSTYGGINRAPKFPSSLPVRFLLRDHRRTGNEKSLSMAVLTLEKMAAGGMYDHVGGGFHRYSTDRRWLVPHFEKMLYDNALLTVAYLEGYQVTGRADFAQVAQEILRYVARDMTSPEGAFYSATDADSPVPGQGRRDEGWFFTWTPDEIEAVLGSEKARLVKEYYAVTTRGNFEGRSILNTPISLDEVAKKLGMSETDAQFEILEAKDLLYEVRASRPPPLRDEKILAAWNGLMISAHARAAIVLADKSYATRAAKAADFVLTQMRRDGRLFRSYKNGQPRHNGYLADYAFMIAGVLDLFEATGDPRWLKEAMEMEEVLEKHYVDKSAGGYFMISDDHEKLLARQKPGYDGAEPTGNSVHALNLLRLYEFTTQDRYRQRGEKTLKAFGQTLERSAGALSEMLLALDFYLDRPLEIVIVTSKDKSEAEPFLKKLRSTFLPNRVLTIANEGEEVAAQAKVMPLIGGKTTLSGKATAYVCEQGICDLPTSDPEVFAKQISKIRRSIN